MIMMITCFCFFIIVTFSSFGSITIRGAENRALERPNWFVRYSETHAYPSVVGPS